MKKDNSRWLRLILGCVTLLMAGVIYAWSNLRVPLKETFSQWTEAQMQLCFTLTLCFFCLGGMLSGLIAKRVSMRARMLAAAVLVAGGFILVAGLQGSILQLYIGYGLMAGTGIGIVYNVVIAATNAWFPDRKGIASGALMMAFGFSALLFGKLGGALFPESAMGWRGTFRFFGILIGAVLAIAAFLVKVPEKPTQKAAAKAETGEEIDTARMIRRPSFWKLFVFFTLLAAVGSTAIGFGKNFFLSVGLADGTAATIAALLSIFNGLGRLCSGALYDQAGARKTQMITSAIAIGAPALCLIAVLGTIPFVGIIGLSLCVFSYGFSPTVSAALTAGFYGNKNFGLNLAVLNLDLIPASFVSTLAGGLYQASGAYVSTFIVLTCMSVVGLIVNFTIKKA